jgi:hypothetical protein
MILYNGELYRDESGYFKRPDKLKSDNGVIYTLIESEPCGIYVDENGVEFETYVTLDSYYDSTRTWTKTIYGDDGRKLFRSFELKPFKDE